MTHLIRSFIIAVASILFTTSAFAVPGASKGKVRNYVIVNLTGVNAGALSLRGLVCAPTKRALYKKLYRRDAGTTRAWYQTIPNQRKLAIALKGACYAETAILWAEGKKRIVTASNLNFTGGWREVQFGQKNRVQFIAEAGDDETSAEERNAVYAELKIE